jgi:hypothetical protein
MTTRPNEAIARNLEIELSSLYSQYHSREFDIHPREVEAEAIRLILDALKMTTNPTQDPKDSQKSRQRSHRNAPGHSSESLNHPLKRHFPAPNAREGWLTYHPASGKPVEVVTREDYDWLRNHAAKLAEALREIENANCG